MSETEPTIEDMLKALGDAGRSIPKTAKDEEIELAFIELQGEQEAEAQANAKKQETKKKKAETSDLDEVLKNADPLLGDKDPAVIEWCRENLTTEEFEKRYSGRKFRGA